MTRTIQVSALFAALCMAVGCDKINILGRKLDVASEHITTDKPVYEGQLQSAKKIGAQTALQFRDGQSFEVVEVQADLVPGDTVRIYKTEKGYVAHLWHSTDSQLPPGAIPTTPPPSGPYKLVK